MSVSEITSAPRVLEVPGARISYRDEGHGPPFVLLHGGGPGATGWGNFRANVADFADIWRVLLPDMPGFGDSEFTADGGRAYVVEAAAAIAAFLEALGLSQVNLLGNSLGGAVATRVAIDFPHHVRRLALMGPAGARSGLFTPGPTEGVKLLMSYYPEPSLEKMRRLVTTFVHDGSDPRYEEIAQARYETSIDPKRVAGYRRVSDPSYPPNVLSKEDLARVTAPTLLIWGRDDRFVGVDDALTFLAGLDDARLLLLPKCGHWVQADRPADFAAHLNAFLTEGT